MECSLITNDNYAKFEAFMEKLFRKYPEELFLLEGIHPTQRSIHHMSKAYFKNHEQGVVDHSIDPNANVSGRDVITFAYEVPKPSMKWNSLYNLWNTLYTSLGEDTANLAIVSEIKGVIYINDVWDIGRPYCFNFCTLDIALEGLKMSNRLKVDPPKGLSTFFHQVEQFTVYAANSTLGATGLADLLITASWYVDSLLEKYQDHKVELFWSDESLWQYVREQMTHLIYTLNWEFRGNQSPFTNVSIYDEVFLDQLLPSYLIQGQAPKKETVKKVQQLFLEVYNETLRRTPITFPVVTVCLSVDEQKNIKDEDFLTEVCDLNREFGFVNFYMGETSTLSSCCRLRSNVNDLGYSNTFGAGSTKIGSLGVVTLNLPRIARFVNALMVGASPHYDTIITFLGQVGKYTKLIACINHAKRMFITDRIERGSLPLYTLGFMDLKHQYSTCGFTGLYEALEILGLDIRDERGLEVAKSILNTINEANQLCSGDYGTPHNMEQVPAESSSVKLAQKDILLGYNPEGYELYSNQFVPLWEQGVDLLDRIYIQGQLDPACTGGAICHLNIGTPIKDTVTMVELVRFAAKQGVVYFALNYKITQCENGHMTVNAEGICPICGASITDIFTRVVGFLTNTKNWNKTRREFDFPNREFYGADNSLNRV